MWIEVEGGLLNLDAVKRIYLEDCFTSGVNNWIMKFYLKNDEGEFYEVYENEREAEEKYRYLKELLTISESKWVSGIPRC